MSLTKQQIHCLVNELAPLIQRSQFKQFYRSIDDHYILHLHKESEHHALLFCFRNPFVRFHLISKAPIRIDDPFSDLVCRLLEGSLLEKIETINEDRIVKWSFLKGGKQLSLFGEFFSKKGNVYLLDQNHSILAALNPTGEVKYQLPEKPTNDKIQIKLPETCLTSRQVNCLYRQLEQTAAFQKEKNSALEIIKQKMKRGRKKHAEFLAQLKVAEGWQTIHHEAELLLSNMYNWKKGIDKMSVKDWENNGIEMQIALDPTIPLSSEVSARFRKSKKLKASIPYVQGQLTKIARFITECEAYQAQINTYTTLEELENFKKLPGFQKQAVITPYEVEERRAQPYFEYKSASNLSIWVGKSAKDNEKLTFSLSKGSDWWLHVQGFPGSHVILRVAKNSEPDPEALKDAMQLALAYSKAKDKGEADIVVTQRKFVSRFGKGQAGKVQISKHKVMQARFDQGRFQQIKERKN